jgi:uncharacterized protein
LTLEHLLFSRHGTLRAPWRLSIFAGAILACVLISAAVVGPLVARLYAAMGLHFVSVAGWVEVTALLGAHWFALRWIDRRPWRDVGLHRAAARPATLARGLALGALVVSVPTTILILVGWLAPAEPTATDWLLPVARITMLLVPAALFEELLVRGYALSVLRDAWGWRWALVATSAAFALLHLQNHGATAHSLAVVALAGLFLGAIRVATDSLYAAWAAHLAWNWMLAAVFHAPVSGYPFEAPGYRYVDAGPDWATGGIWGPEAGLGAVLMMVAVLAYLYARRQRRGET